MENLKELTPIKSRVTKMQKFVTDVVIKDKESLDHAVNVLSGIKSVQKEIKAWKDDRIKPIKESVKKIEADIKPYETNCKEAEVDVKDKILAYHQEVAKNEAEAEAKIAKKVEEGKIKVDTGARQLDKVERAETSIKTNKGAVSIKKVRKFEVVSLKDLPLKYHLANEVEIRKDMLAGIEVEGVRYFEEEQISAR